MTKDNVFLTKKVTNKMIYTEIKGLRLDVNSTVNKVKLNSLGLKFLGAGFVLIGIVITLAVSLS